MGWLLVPGAEDLRKDGFFIFYLFFVKGKEEKRIYSLIDIKLDLGIIMEYHNKILFVYNMFWFVCLFASQDILKVLPCDSDSGRGGIFCFDPTLFLCVCFVCLLLRIGGHHKGEGVIDGEWGRTM